MDSHQAKLLLLNAPFRFNPTSTFLGITFVSTLFFLKDVSSLKVKFFPRLKALRWHPHGAPSKSPSLSCIKLFFSPFSLMLHPDGFLFYALAVLLNRNAFTKRLVSPSPAASRLTLSLFSFLRCLYLPNEKP